MSHAGLTQAMFAMVALCCGAAAAAPGQTQKPVYEYQVSPVADPTGGQPDRLFASSSAVILGQIESSEAELVHDGMKPDGVKTVHLVRIVEVLKGDPALTASPAVRVEEWAGQADAGDYIVKTTERPLEPGLYILFLQRDPANRALVIRRSTHAFRIKDGKIDTAGGTTRKGSDAESLLRELRTLKPR